MQVDFQLVEGIGIATLAGHLNRCAGISIQQLLAGHIEADRANIALDLAGVTSMDASGLAALVTTLKQARQNGGDIVLLNPQASVQEDLEMVQLH